MRKHADLKQHWICENCEKPHVDKDPPDACPHCGHPYFENLADLVTQAEAEEVS